MALTEHDISVIRSIVQDEVKQQQEETHIATQDNKLQARKIKGRLHTDGHIPDRYLPLASKGKYVTPGHRGNLVDIAGFNGRVYYNVAVASAAAIDTKFKQTQMFEITFISEEDVYKETHGEDGSPTLTANPIKSNIFEYAFQEILSTYTPDSYDKMKGMPFCQEPPSVKDMLSKMTKVNPDMVVMSAKKGDDEIENDFKGALRKALGLGDDDPIPPLDEVAKDNPEALIDAEKKARSNTDRPSMVIDKNGVAIANPQGNGRINVTKQGVSTNGTVIHAQKPDVPMDIVGVNTFELPINDMMPKGNVFTVHPQRLPKLDEILSLGLMATRFVTTSAKLFKVMAEFSKL